MPRRWQSLPPRLDPEENQPMVGDKPAKHRPGVACALAAATVLAMGAVSCQADDPQPAAGPKFPLAFRIVDPDNPDNADKQPGDLKLPPLIVVFQKGLTATSKDASGPIGRLEALRGASKVLPKSNDDPGLPVLLAGLRFHERQDASGKVVGYDVELQGEYNAVKVPAPDEAMNSFLAGKRTSFALESKLNYGIIATTSTTTLELQLVGDKLYIYSAEGDFTLREAFSIYKSDTYKTVAPKSRKYLYYGEPGDLPTLRIL